ncbi:hypothetical protein Mth01_39320 [Sphaerimonospora thailandensis]|uniref:Uncharacterized protein n=1 Tax=Sphaerimonospora thailandensis TaxID=795644 RepID=A0A8J3RD88_9ACTN|nr:hypothetical protein Mth01_39320 [Sphaerimonospora thailandensis]
MPGQDAAGADHLVVRVGVHGHDGELSVHSIPRTLVYEYFSNDPISPLDPLSGTSADLSLRDIALEAVGGGLLTPLLRSLVPGGRLVAHSSGSGQGTPGHRGARQPGKGIPIP